MNKILIISTSLFLLFSCTNLNNRGIKVNNANELKKAVATAEPGDEIILANGVWKDLQINFIGKGTKEKPIILKAETAGKVFIEGQSYIKIAGEYLQISGLYFKNGYSPADAVLEFRINKDSIANHCSISNCVIKDFVKPNRLDQDHWIIFWGRNNQLNHCYLAGKFNQGPTIRVYLAGNENIRTYHQITNNHFGPKPRKGGPKAESIQIGDSYTSMAPAYVTVANNYFEECNGEVEIISNKSNFNEFRNNIFYHCEGSLVFRHGNYCIADGNIFIGDGKNPFFGGIRVINTGHWLINNYFYKIIGDEFRSPLAIMNGIPKSPLNRYNQVTDVVIAYNSWIDCKSPWQFSVGANINKKDVLPETEIRSARPIRTLLANNLIYNHQGDSSPIKAYDIVDGIKFKNNLINNQINDSLKIEGINSKSLSLNQLSEYFYAPEENKDALFENVYLGFDFENIQKDLFGKDRSKKNFIGAIVPPVEISLLKIDKKRYGANWYSNDKQKRNPEIISVSSTKTDIVEKLANAKNGDILELTGEIQISAPLVINKRISIRSKDENNKAKIIYSGAKNSPAFQMAPNGDLILENIILSGENEQYAFAPLEKNMSNIYKIRVTKSEISQFEKLLFAYKGSMADSIIFLGTTIKNCKNGIELAAETDDKGDYNAEVVSFENCDFENIQSNVINFYRGGYDESTIGGCLTVKNSKFTKCGGLEKSKILLQTRGIVNVEISKNEFNSNPTKYIAILWGEKNNKHGENAISNSGEILVEKYLKQKLVY
ncbi:MAG: chondroitinase-B domain-containing protein [Bacteroidales bacterium]|nr:chondroitinase-B domain-containing protein [Bacteroidales bacterium]